MHHGVWSNYRTLLALNDILSVMEKNISWKNISTIIVLLVSTNKDNLLQVNRNTLY